MKIALCGYSGKTGQEVYNMLIKNHYDVIGIDQFSKPLYEVIDEVELVIDFTNKKQALKHIYTCLDYHKPFIIGTTGFSTNELLLIKNLCIKEKVKGMICYNFALPINYLLNHFDVLKKYFKDFSYKDVHHISKIDKSSGTTYLFMLKDKKMSVQSIKTSSTQIVYILTCKNQYEKLTFIYQISKKEVFAKGVLHYLKNKDNSFFINLLA